MSGTDLINSGLGSRCMGMFNQAQRYSRPQSGLEEGSPDESASPLAEDLEYHPHDEDGSGKETDKAEYLQ